MKRISAWLVARGGVSRLTLFAMALGLGIAGFRPPPPAYAIAATCSLAVVLAGVGLRGGLGWSGRATVVVGSASVRVAVPFLAIALGFLMGVTVGSVRMAALVDGELARSAGVPGASFRGQVVLTGRPQERGRTIAAIARSLGPVGAGEEVLLEVTGAHGAAAPEAGDVRRLLALEEGSFLEVEGRLRAPETSAGGAGAKDFDEAAWLLRQGVASVLIVRASELCIVGARTGAAGLLDRLRSRARAHLAIGLDSAMAGLLNGFILGDTSGIPEPVIEAYRRAGTAHILCVSGLHVASLAAAVLLVCRAVGASPWVRTAAAGATVIVFALLTGAGPSVVRATVVVLVVLSATLAGRGRDSWSALALAGVVVLARDPPAAGGVGFQLSFSAVAALLLLARPFEARLAPHVPGVLATGLAVSLAASLGTAPVSLLTFGQVSMVGVVANPLVVPIASLVMALGAISIAAGFVWPPMCVVFNTAAGTAIGWVTVVSRAFAAAPVVTGDDVLPFVAALGGGLLAWFAWHRARRRRAPAACASRVKGPVATLVCLGLIAAGGAAGVGLVGAATAAAAHADLWWAGRSWPVSGEVRVLDVGEGAAVLVRSSEGAAVLIDAGPPGQGLAEELRHLGVGRLDAVVVTHPHADHYGGLMEVGESLTPRLLVDHVVGGGSETTVTGEATEYMALQRRTLEGGARHLVPLAGEAVEIGDLRLEFLTPPAPLAPRSAGGWGKAGEGWGKGGGTPVVGGSELTSERLNQASLVVVVRLKGLAILVPGDAEADVLARYPLPDVDVLVVSHHGSEGAVTVPVLGRLTPSVSVVPVGAGNTFGHPSAATVRLLSEWGTALLRTDHSGWVALRPSNGAAMDVLAER